MQRCLKLLALAGCRGFLLPRAPRITPPRLQKVLATTFSSTYLQRPTSAASSTTRRTAAAEYDAAPYAEHDYERAQDDDGASVDVAAVDALLAKVQMKDEAVRRSGRDSRRTPEVHGVRSGIAKGLADGPRRRSNRAARPA